MMNPRKLPTDMNTNRYEKLMQVPPRGAERASSDGVTIEEYRPVDQRRSMTTVAEVYTNFTDKSEQTLSQGSAVVAKEAGIDGTTNVRDRSIDRNTMKTSNMQMPMDFLEIPEPTLPRGFLELAGFCYCYGIQFTRTNDRGYESRWCIYRGDTNQKFCWMTETGRPVGPRWLTE